MNDLNLPLVVEPSELEQHLGHHKVRVVDLSQDAFYGQHHVPHAVHLAYNQIVSAKPPTLGLLPDLSRLSETLSSLGLTPDCHIIACDDEGNGKAARLLWTLDALGHKNLSLLNGGSRAWVYEGHPTEEGFTPAKRGDYPLIHWQEHSIATKEYILNKLNSAKTRLVDTRTAAEFMGQDTRATRGGHIPGAVNFEWTKAIDTARGWRIRNESELGRLLTPLGITPNKEVIVYCHTHHRSAHTYWVLKSLGYPKIKGYAGSWSDWGNDPETPVKK